MVSPLPPQPPARVCLLSPSPFFPTSPLLVRAAVRRQRQPAFRSKDGDSRRRAVAIRAMAPRTGGARLVWAAFWRRFDAAHGGDSGDDAAHRWSVAGVADAYGEERQRPAHLRSRDGGASGGGRRE
ncbi:hypothetical protein ABZP36_034363 [Zizania latifolia]